MGRVRALCCGCVAASAVGAAVVLAGVQVPARDVANDEAPATETSTEPTAGRAGAQADSSETAARPPQSPRSTAPVLVPSPGAVTLLAAAGVLFFAPRRTRRRAAGAAAGRVPGDTPHRG